MLSHYYFFCSFSCTKICTQLLCIHSSRGWKSTIKKFSIYSEPPCMYWEILYVIRSTRKRIISYKHEAGRRKTKKENHLRCEEKCNEEISRFFLQFPFATSCVVEGWILSFFIFLLMLAVVVAPFYGYFLCYVCLQFSSDFYICSEFPFFDSLQEKFHAFFTVTESTQVGTTNSFDL